MAKSMVKSKVNQWKVPTVDPKKPWLRGKESSGTTSRLVVTKDLGPQGMSWRYLVVEPYPSEKSWSEHQLGS